MIELITAYSAKEIITFIVILAFAIKGLVSFLDWIIPKVTGVVHKVDEYQELKEKVNKLEHDVGLLIKSSIMDFRSQLVKDHRYYIERGWIDHYSLEALEDQFKIYKEEGGNSFAEQLMIEIRALSKEAPKDE